jgi:SAM-dependent methyltransferase
MKTRESGMPGEGYWESFFQPEATLRLLGLSGACRDVLEVGCGYGTFTIPAARIASGTVYSLDIDADMVARTSQRAHDAGLANVRSIQHDFLTEPSPVADADFVMLFNILHAEQSPCLLTRARAALRAGGLLGIIHWNHDPETPRGPSMEIRPRPEDIRRLAVAAGFAILTPHVDLPPWHYGIVAQKPG